MNGRGGIIQGPITGSQGRKGRQGSGRKRCATPAKWTPIALHFLSTCLLLSLFSINLTTSVCAEGFKHGMLTMTVPAVSGQIGPRHTKH